MTLAMQDALVLFGTRRAEMAKGHGIRAPLASPLKHYGAAAASGNVLKPDAPDRPPPACSNHPDKCN